jgi:hypothetical protein
VQLLHTWKTDHKQEKHQISVVAEMQKKILMLKIKITAEAGIGGKFDIRTT